MTKTAKRNLYQEVTNRIIALLEKGTIPWRMGWSQYGLARNYATGHIYSGINLILMNHTLHPIPYFMTFNQVKEQEGKIRKGAKSEQVIYFNVCFKDGDNKKISKEQARRLQQEGKEVNIYKFLKYYNVFNISDIEGIEFEIPELELKDNEKLAHCEAIIKNMPNHPEFKQINGNRAFYSPMNDYINMPDIRQFISSEEYYATFFHELIHSTGHQSRLNRPEVVNLNKFGGKEYSQEELVAEMGASFLCAQAGIDYDEIVENNAAYIAGWLKVLKADNQFIFKSAAEAQKAANYILDAPLG